MFVFKQSNWRLSFPSEEMFSHAMQFVAALQQQIPM
jgi:hypothetical protein